MGGKKLLQRLLRMKGFRITWFELHERKREVLIGVKPHKTGCHCPHCDRRCEIVTILPEWRDVVLCGMEVFFIIPERFCVLPMVEFRRTFCGRTRMHESPIGLNISYLCIAS
jgi:hypothetical protein